MKNIILTIAVIVTAFLVFVFFPLYRGAYPSSDLAGMWYSAFIGFILSAVITCLLLKIQSSGEVHRERQAEVFKEKLQIYKNYLELIGKIIGDEKIERDEEVELRVLTASIAMHTSANRMKGICANVRDVVLSMCDKENRDTMDRFMKEFIYGQDEKVSDERVRSDALLTNLMNISNYFREELYDTAHHDSALIDSMKRDFARLFELANPSASDDTNESNIDNAEDKEASTKVEALKENIVQIVPNWSLKLGSESTWKKLSLEPKGDKKWGEIYIRPWGDRCAMVMRYLNEAGEAVKAFADEMKYWGFYRSNLRTVYGEWRNTLDDDQWCKKHEAQKLLSNGAYSFPQEIKPDEFLTRYKEDSFFRSHLENTLKSLVEYMEQYRRRCYWKDLLSEYESNIDNLNIYPHITTLWCDYSTPTKDGFVRLSLNEETQKDDKILAHVLISRYNADTVFESLLDVLPKALKKPKEQLLQEINEKGHICVDAFDFVMNEDKTVNEEQTAVLAKAIFEKWNIHLKTI